MGIFLPKDQRHKMEAQREAEMNKYRNMISDMSKELFEWLKEKVLNAGDFEIW